MLHQAFRVPNHLNHSSPKESHNQSHSLNLSNPNTRLLNSNRCLLLITRKTNNLITSFPLNLNPNSNMQILLHLNHSIHRKYSNNNRVFLPALSLNSSSNSRKNSNHLLRNTNHGAEKTD
jgi:hypothetical protein